MVGGFDFSAAKAKAESSRTIGTHLRMTHSCGYFSPRIEVFYIPDRSRCCCSGMQSGSCQPKPMLAVGTIASQPRNRQPAPAALFRNPGEAVVHQPGHIGFVAGTQPLHSTVIGRQPV